MKPRYDNYCFADRALGKAPTIYNCDKDVRHSYIIELKYVKSDASVQETEAVWQEGVAQANRYYECRRVKVLSQGTELHRIVMLFRGRVLERMEELKS